MDGFGAEFYKVYASHLAVPLAHTINYVFTSGNFPPSRNVTCVVILYKKGRNLLDVRSYRPISLLNQDYKIFMALITRRLNKIIRQYVHSDQSGFIPDWNIMNNIFKTLEIIHHGRLRQDCSSIVLSLDIEKAFDSI